MATILPRFRKAFLGLAVKPAAGQCLRPLTTPLPCHKTRASNVLSFAHTRFYSSPKLSQNPSSSPLNQLGSNVAKQDLKKRLFVNEDSTTDGHTTSKNFAFFMMGSAVSVFGIVVFGGLTRLTESGLSITEWKPVTGALPPLNQADWEAEFTLYRSSPEFHVLNANMTLEEFKKIYFMEWAHRVWGRFIGVGYFAGLLWFAARRKPAVLTKKMAAGATAVLLGIGAQGFVGWWMVKSGLKDDLFAPGSHPRVSHYRLMVHLAMAFGLYSAMFLMGSRVINNRFMLSYPLEASKMVAQLQDPVLRTFRRCAYTLTMLVFATAMSGALVAGLDAGLIYNEFPYMGNGLHPPKSELFDEFYCRREDQSDMFWRNMLENPAAVQLNHRVLAVTTLTSVLALFAYSRTSRVAAVIPPRVKKSVTGLVHATLLQVVLGITTLIYMVPISLGALHQAGSLLVLTSALMLAQKLHVPRSLLPHIQRRLGTVGKAAAAQAPKMAATNGTAKAATQATQKAALRRASNIRMR